jgi:hypothetical protein
MQVSNTYSVSNKLAHNNIIIIKDGGEFAL